MKVDATKNCDSCGKVVATKAFLWSYYTNCPYYTFRSMDRDGWEGTNIRGKIHICEDCWKKIRQIVRVTKLGD
jgi:hypothetical protein